MEDAVRFLVLGLGAGSIYALMALGITLVYRGSGVVNFGHGGFALVGAAAFYELRDSVPTSVALVAGVLVAGVVGALVQLLVMAPMRNASPLARVVATLGILVVLQEAAAIRYGELAIFVPGFLPSDSVHLFGDVFVPQDRIWLAAVTISLTAALWLFYRRSIFGLATTGVAENTRATAALGWSPRLVATVNWAAGGALAGLAGALLLPITGLTPSTLTLTVVPALSAAVIGGFSSFPLALVGGLIVGVLESEAILIQNEHKEIFGAISTTGLSTVVPVLVVILILLVRGQSLPLRSYIGERLPVIGAGRVRPVPTVIAVGAVILSLYAFSGSWVNAIITTGSWALVALSLVVVTGYCGQLSLAQFALAGIGALFASRMADAWSVPFPLALVLGSLLTIPVGLIVAVPALRVRGVNLAVATLGLAVVVSSAVLSNPAYTGGPIRGTKVPTPELFGLNVSSVEYPERYALVVVILLTAAGLAVANLRRGTTGRRLIAVRDNERAAASLGVNVVGAKLYAFGLGSLLAGLAGALMAFRFPSVSFDQFSVFKSIQIVLLSVIGSIGFVTGAVFAGMIAVQGVVAQVLHHVSDPTEWFLFVSAVLLLVVIMVHPDGIAELATRRTGHPIDRLSRRRRRLAEDYTPAVAPRRVAMEPVPPKSLHLRDLAVRFGSVVAVDGLSLEIMPGEVVGLIGPNGAGKTTAIDAASGYVAPASGSIVLGGVPLDRYNVERRAKHGLIRSFQSLELFEDLTVGDNLRVASEAGGWSRYLLDPLRPRRSPFSPAAQASIDEFQLAPVLDKLPTELPYAQRRAVAIARAVAASPSVLLLDEPAAGLDAVSTRELAVLIRRLAADCGMGILLVEHDVSMVLDTCDRIVVLDFGKVIATGTPDEIRNNDRVIEAYLGRPPEDERADRMFSDVASAGDS